jgi:hypothetical protein
MDYERIQVECYSGYKINERPMAFTYQGHRWEIQGIVDRWHEGDIDATRSEVSYFKVKTTEGRIFILRYLSLFDSWSIGIIGQ